MAPVRAPEMIQKTVGDYENIHTGALIEKCYLHSLIAFCHSFFILLVHYLTNATSDSGTLRFCAVSCSQLEEQ